MCLENKTHSGGVLGDALQHTSASTSTGLNALQLGAARPEVAPAVQGCDNLRCLIAGSTRLLKNGRAAQTVFLLRCGLPRARRGEWDTHTALRRSSPPSV